MVPINAKTYPAGMQQHKKEVCSQNMFVLYKIQKCDKIFTYMPHA